MIFEDTSQVIFSNNSTSNLSIQLFSSCVKLFSCFFGRCMLWSQKKWWEWNCMCGRSYTLCCVVLKEKERSRWKPGAEQQYGPWSLVGTRITSSLWSLSLLASFRTASPTMNTPAVPELTVGFIKIWLLRLSYLIKRHIRKHVQTTQNIGWNPNVASSFFFWNPYPQPFKRQCHLCRQCRGGVSHGRAQKPKGTPKSL